ncbi:bifunctional riboflavin kinase/FAD synthetase [Neobacillus sp. MM2021_6]|uniref:bifunctional riboflavin kinase/FAD synthetase n=1 Tax=Bacillaceae TaxID=186817 RepID=UPI00140E3434|nr:MULTISPECIES: bifunctional riboflavin kinase/FAD synthetase [Bacillaceae]MBO0959104.1 bifunctional riboflavin kinase/FAD synthetase [Neobacillus sp. MM2021_6]NHC16977.1 bifunctional riboflavin kinase/FAD synthetase [Bacillus sp. MM2020_4]
MEVIKLNFPLNINKNEIPPLAMALGYFDGVHLGHQQVVLEAKKQADKKGLRSAVMTFDPHPSVVLGMNKNQVQYITPLEEKTKIIESLGIDYLFIVHFTSEFANLLPQEFIDQYVIGLNVQHVVAGFDFTYGRMGKGTMETILFHSRDEFSYSIVPKFVHESEKVSSTRIRHLIKEGNTRGLPTLLGRSYTTTGVVIHGDKRGRTIGFPTANIDIEGEYIIPPLGVYAVRMKVRSVWYNGVCNVGFKPTFNNEARKQSVEVHLFDFDQEIYGDEVMVEWHHYIRKEQKFSGIEQLVAQIEKDKQQTIEYFENNRQSF